MKKILTLVTALVMLGAGCMPAQPVEQTNSMTLPVQAAVEPAPVTQPTAGGVGTVKLFMVAMEDNGKSGKLIGCGDSAVPVTVSIPTTTAPLAETFKALLALTSSYYGQSGLYNPSYADADPNGSFTFSSATITGGVAKIYLKGQISLAGTCEDPRLLSQFEETAKQFATVKNVEIYINNKLFNGSQK